MFLLLRIENKRMVKNNTLSVKPNKTITLFFVFYNCCDFQLFIILKKLLFSKSFHEFMTCSRAKEIISNSWKNLMSNQQK